MHILIPGTFTLVSSNVPVNEAQIFTHKAFAINDLVVYEYGLYKRLTTSNIFPEFDPNKFYIEGEESSYLSVNYIFKKQIEFENPSIDNVNWEVVDVSEWAEDIDYLAGDVCSKDGRIYLCIMNHRSSLDSILEWQYGQSSAYYSYGYCRYNNRYYRLKINFNQKTIFSYFKPDSYLICWQDVTNIIAIPSSDSIYWQDITDREWIGTSFYSQGTIEKFNGSIYRAINAIIFPTPDIDPDRWIVSTTSLPTNKTDWQYYGAVNRFKMFDQYLNTVTQQEGSIDVSLTDVDFNTLYLGNVFADSVEINVINNDTGLVVETSTFDLTNDCIDILDFFIGDWMDYRVPMVTYNRTSVYKNVSVQLKITGDICSVGIFAIGLSYYIGDEVWGVSSEALIFDTVIEDTSTGLVSIEPGNELEVKSIDLWVNSKDMYSINNILKRGKGKPCVYLSKNMNVLTYGFYRKKHKILNNPTKSLISIEVRELL